MFVSQSLRDVMLKNILSIVFALAFVINISNAQINSSFMSLKGHIQLGSFDEGAAEIVSYDAENAQLFVTNAENNTIDIIDISEPSNLTLVSSIDISSYGDGVNSVAVWGGLLAAAIEADVKQDPGKVVVFDTDGNYLWDVTVGALPDMVTFTPDGSYILVANEGEPNDDYSVDPDGSVSIINTSTQDVMTADFTAWNGIEDDLRIEGVRIFGPNASTSQDLEPEYIAVNADGTTAWVALQENNAFAIIDIETASVTDIVPLGTKDHSIPGNGLDASDKDDKVNIRNWPVKGFYLPDAIATYEVNGETYILSANEGDAREYDTFEEEVRVKDVELDPTVFDNIEWLQDNDNLGRLAITQTIGDLDNDGLYEELYSFGARSFTIWNSDAELVWDSGDDFEVVTSNVYGYDFNNNNDENEGDTRSDAKGPEPEAVTVGEIDGHYYAFIALERMGGIMVYDVTNPMMPEYVTYVNNRDFDADIEDAGDLAPECVVFIPADDSPNGKNLVVVSNEVSGTVSVFEINDTPNTYKLQVMHSSDLEGGVDAVDNAPNYAALVDKFEDEYSNSALLLSGDNWIPSPFFNASLFVSSNVFADVYGDLYGDDVNTSAIGNGRGHVDATIMNILGVDASALGNHEFDAGTNQVADILGISYDDEDGLEWLGTQFPYLSANLDFSGDWGLNNLYTSDILMNTDFMHMPADIDGSTFNKKIAPATILEKGGEKIGVVGATTQLLQSITSVGNVSVIGPKENDMDALADILQPYIDDMINNHGVNKVFVVTHLQQFALEQALIGKLSGVDVIFAGGSDHVMTSGSQELYPGTEKEGSYPYITENADGETALIVSTDGEYRYVGRLVVTFDENGLIEIPSLDPRSGAYSTTESELLRHYDSEEEAFAENSKGELVQRLTEAVADVVLAQDGNIFGKSDVYLEGRRHKVRTEESNLGNLTADANLFLAQTYDEEVMVSIKNGGGIRASIGEVVEVENGVYEFCTTTANPAAGKEAGEISQLDIANSLRFNNTLTILELTPAELKMVIEHSISKWTETAQPGQFCQVGGIKFSFDPNAQAQELAFNEDGDIVGIETEGMRIQTMVITNPHTGNIVDVVVKNGEIFGNPERTIKTVTLNFLADYAGDNYPYLLSENYDNRIDLTEVIDYEGNATFAEDGSEQDALAEFLSSHYNDFAYNYPETEKPEDDRIQNLMYRNDDILTLLITTEDVSTCKETPTEIGFEPVLCGGFCDSFPQIEGGSDDLTFEWYPTYGLDDPYSPNPVVLNPRVTRTYTVHITDEVLGETYVDNVTLYLEDGPDISVPLFVMKSLGEPVVLNDLVTVNSGTPDFVYNWTDGSNNTYTGYDEITHNSTGIYRYYVNVTDNDGEGCPSRTKRVIVFVSWYKNSFAEQFTPGVNGSSFIYTYPNPAVNELKILSEFADYTDAVVQLVDMSGRIINEFNYSNVISIEKSVDVSELASGSYFILINSNDDSAVHKFIKK
jgi:2',3'-cyclic-nucleotide 2'-phosphodiesterase/3'-nucleotidase/5'-nucleotidase